MDAIQALYGRYQALLNEVDIKGEGLKPWQVTALNQLAGQAEGVLQGTRRKTDRRVEV